MLRKQHIASSLSIAVEWILRKKQFHMISESLILAGVSNKVEIMENDEVRVLFFSVSFT